MSRGLIVLVVLVACPFRALASEADLLREPQTGLGSRAIALAGAFVALSDDESSLNLNPAGLVGVPRSLEAHLTGWPTDGVRPFRLGGAFHPTQALAAGFSYSRLPALPLTPTRPGCSSTGDSELEEYAVGGAYQPNRRVSAGATFLWQRLRPPGGSGIEGAPSFAIGFLYRPPHELSPRLGLRYQHGTTWRFHTGVSRSTVGSPRLLSAGAAWYYDSHVFVRRVTLTLQPDYVWYSKLSSEQGSARPNDAVTFRAGLEASVPFGCWTGCGAMLQVRLGIVSAGLPQLRSAAVAAEAAVGREPERRHYWSAGAALAPQAFHGRVKLELAYDRQSRTIALGIGYRFPTAFRADIEDASRR